MKELILKKLEELDKDYDMWLNAYDRDGLEYQEDELLIVRTKISILNEIIREYEE